MSQESDFELAKNTAHIQHKRILIRPWREIGILLVMLMEISWVAPWFNVLIPRKEETTSIFLYLALLSVILVSHWIVRLMGALRLKASIRKIITLIMMVISILIGLRMLLYAHEQLGLLEFVTKIFKNIIDWQLALPVEFILILVVLIGWWRGISLAREHIEPSSVLGYFQLGVFMFLAYIVFYPSTTQGILGGYIYIFLLCSLVAMATARIGGLETLRGGRQTSFNIMWLGGVIAASLGLVFFAVWLADVIGNHLSWIGYLILAVLGVLAVIILLLISPILLVMIFLIRNLQFESDLGDKITETVDKFVIIIQEFMRQVASLVDRLDILTAIKRIVPFLRAFFLISLIIVIAIGVLKWVSKRLWEQRQKSQVEEDQNSIIDGRGIWRILIKSLLQGWDNLTEKMVNAVDIKRRLQARAVARIRQIYANVLSLGEELGCARLEAQTPLEFLPVIRERLPHLGTELTLITQAYLKVRYGQLPENQAELQAVESAWKKVHEVSRMEVSELARKNSP